jgi:hypothetical protein
MLEACPGAFINIGNAGSVGSCAVQTRITTSTTLHCLLEQVSSRDWSRKSCHDFRLRDIISLLHVEPSDGPAYAAKRRATIQISDI